MSKKIYNKSKFGFLNNNLSEENSSYYYRREIRIIGKFPFIKTEII